MIRNALLAGLTAVVLSLASLAISADAQEPPPRAMVGAYYFDGWSRGTDHVTKLLETEYAARKPVWGWYDDTVEIMQTQIDYEEVVGFLTTSATTLSERSTMLDRVRPLMLFVLFGVPGIVRAGEPGPSFDRWDRAVFLRSEKSVSGGGFPVMPATFASGFFVGRKDDLFLVTARHATDDTALTTQVQYVTPSGESRWIHLGLLRGAKEGNPWSYHRKADIACLRVDLVRLDGVTKAYLTAIAIPWDSLVDPPPPRSSPIEVVGFPLAIGSYEGISPIVVRGSVASRVVAVPGKWENEHYLLATPAVGRGSSGGPVFQVMADEKAASLVGLYAGAIVDDSGAKLAKIVPARQIREAIETLAPAPVPVEATGAGKL